VPRHFGSADGNFSGLFPAEPFQAVLSPEQYSTCWGGVSKPVQFPPLEGPAGGGLLELPVEKPVAVGIQKFFPEEVVNTSNAPDLWGLEVFYSGTSFFPAVALYTAVLCWAAILGVKVYSYLYK